MKQHRLAETRKGLSPRARHKREMEDLTQELVEDNKNRVKGQVQYECTVRPMSAAGESPYAIHSSGVFKGYIDNLHGHFMPIDEGTTEQRAIQNGMCPIYNTNSPGQGEPVASNGSKLLMEVNNSEGVAYAGNTRNMRGVMNYGPGLGAQAGIGGGALSGMSDLPWGSSQAGAHDGPISDIIRKSRRSSVAKGSFGTAYKYYFPNLAKDRLVRLLNDLNAYVKSRGHDIEFFNFGTIRDIEAAMVGGGGRSKGSNHGFGLAIDALVKATGKKEKKGSGVVTKKFTLNGVLTDKIKGNYHARNKVIIQDHTLMKVLDDFSKLSKNADVRWGGRFKRGKKHEIPNVGTLYTMELHHWEIHPDYIAKYWEPHASKLKAVGITTTPKTTKQNLAAMQALWGQYQREQQGASTLTQNNNEQETEVLALNDGQE